MSSVSRRSQGPTAWGASDPNEMLLLCLIGLVVIAAAIALGGAHLAVLVNGTREHLPANPVTLATKLVEGKRRWPRLATEFSAGIAVLLLAVVVIARRAYLRNDGHVDRSARWMGRTKRDLAPLAYKEVKKKAAGFGLESAGLPIARAIGTGVELYSDYEACQIDVWGPRRGKTTSRAIPTILAAPGPVLFTSNKRSGVDETRDVRQERNGRVWVFDPQTIAGEPVRWWYNPLSYVRSERHALELADVFASASRDATAKTDAFFDNAGQALVADLVLAAAVAKRPLPQVYTWLARQTDDEPVRILETAGYRIMAEDVKAKINAAAKERSGVFNTALGMCAFMVNADAMEWVTPPSSWRTTIAGQPREIPAEIPEFNPYEFVQSQREGDGETLYLLSKEGKAGAGPLVAALTLAVCEAGEDVAKRRPRGRLAVPLTVVLDEAANVVRLRQLPDLYSHYGSRGICLITILQSWAQGVEAWGREGMEKMWSAANVKVYGGGVGDTEFLERISKLIGDYDLFARSVSIGGKQGGNVSHSSRRERILEIADLGAIPLGRVIVMPSGGKPVLAAPVPWMAGRKSDVAAIRASIAAHDPSRDRARDVFVPLGDAAVDETEAVS